MTFLDRNTGRALAISLWESEAALEVATPLLSDPRREAEQATGVTGGDHERYEVIWAG